MATQIVSITYDSTQTAATVANRMLKPAAQSREYAEALTVEATSLGGGTRRGTVTASLETGDATKASATVTLGGANIAAGDTIQIGPVTLSWEVAPANQDEVAFVNTASTDGDALAAAVNAHTVLATMVSAASDGAGVVTISAAIPGNIGRHVLARVETNPGAMVLSAATLGGVTSAVQSAPRTYTYGM